MKIYIPAWHYWARAIVQRTWGWSPIEEMALLTLDRVPGTIKQLSDSLGIPVQVASSAVARLMQFGLIEVRFSPHSVLATSTVGHNFIRSNQALPEHTEEREVQISLVFEKVGQSVLRKRDVDIIPVRNLPSSARSVSFPAQEVQETHDTMAERVARFLEGSLRPGEWLRGVEAISSVIQPKYLEVDLEHVKNGTMPDGATDILIQALQSTIETGVLPQATNAEYNRPSSAEIAFGADQIIVGSDEHLERFLKIVEEARDNVFVLSTFVAMQEDKQGKERREFVWKALEDAVRRGVRCHLFFGTSIETAPHAAAMQQLAKRLSAVRSGGGFVLVQHGTVGSHAKIVAADDGNGGAAVLLGSCNFLQSPFTSVEVSAELRDREAAATGLALLRSVVSSLSSASRSAETLDFMAADLRRRKNSLSLSDRTKAEPRAVMTVIYAHEHQPLLRTVAHDAQESFICSTNKMGAPMVPALFNPAEVAGRRLNDARVYYSRYSGTTKRKHVTEQKERLSEIVQVLGIKKPQVHGKFLAWDGDHIVISSINWGSQSGQPNNRLDELGLRFDGPGLAAALMQKFEAHLKN